jgi:hypothetical protein
VSCWNEVGISAGYRHEEGLKQNLKETLCRLQNKKKGKCVAPCIITGGK